MIRITATKLRKNLFNILSMVSKGETISIKRNGKDVAIITSVKNVDWRDKIKTKPKLLIPVDEVFKPLSELWDDYL